MLGWHSQTESMQLVTVSDDLVRLKVCLTNQANLRGVWVRTEPDNEELLTEMALVSGGPHWNIYEALVSLNSDRIQTPYAFKVATGSAENFLDSNENQCYWLSAAGWNKRLPGIECHFKILKENNPPDWAQDQIFYQILPDRFYNGNPACSVRSGEYLYNDRHPSVSKNWDDPIDYQNDSREFYGGDLPGITSRLDYLQALGITAIYLNPILQSPSNHKYDCTDYLKIDPHLGGDDSLAELRTATTARGMRLLLDAVINHTSVQHPWMTKALAGSQEYRNRYAFDELGNYASWKGHSTLPVLNYSDQKVVNYFYAGTQSVVKHWLRPPFRIDGWRLDVIHMLGEGKGAAHNLEHVSAIRSAVKSENPEAYMLGEHFSEATQWLQGQHHDGAMNYYGFLQPVWGFLASTDINYQPTQLSADDFADWLTEARSKIPFSIQKSQLNLLDSHDTQRIYTLLAENTSLMKLAIGLQFTYIGVPCVYYGDEVGMTGGNDPDCRKPMCLQETLWNNEIGDFYGTMINIRKRFRALRRGDLIDLYAQDNLYIFCRVTGAEQIVVAVNRGKEIRLTDKNLSQWLNGFDWQPLLAHSALVTQADLIISGCSISMWWNGCTD